MSNRKNATQTRRVFMSPQEARWMDALEYRVNQRYAEYKDCPAIRFRKRNRLYLEWQKAAAELEEAQENYQFALSQLF